jgi:hypothetical protein
MYIPCQNLVLTFGARLRNEGNDSFWSDADLLSRQTLNLIIESSNIFDRKTPDVFMNDLRSIQEPSLRQVEALFYSYALANKQVESAQEYEKLKLHISRAPVTFTWMTTIEQQALEILAMTPTEREQHFLKIRTKNAARLGVSAYLKQS